MPSILCPETIHQEQQSDEELQQLIRSTNSSVKLQRLAIDGTPSIYCDVSSGVVRPFISKNLRRVAFDTVHGLAHPSGRVTARMLREKYIWPGIKKDALEWCRNCVPCQRSKIQRHNRLTPQHIDVPDARFNHVHLDLIELPVVNQLRYCLTIIDRFSRWPVVVPLKDMTAETVCTAFYSNWVAQFGTPLTITTDQGSQFESALFLALTRLIGANRIRTTPYHPQSNGLIERWHRTLKAALMCNNQAPWPDVLPTVLLGLRTSYKEDLKASPADLVYGTGLRVPGEFFVSEDMPADPQIFLEKIREHIRGLRPTPTAHHTKSRLFILKNLYSCTHVFLRIDAVKRPLEPPYSGPHEVVERMDDYVFKIRVDGVEKVVSVERLKPAYTAKEDEVSIQNTEHPETSQMLQIPEEQDTVQLRAGFMDKPLRTYSKKNKTVSFPAHSTKVTGGRVDVATPSPADSNSTAERRDDRHKNATQPRRRQRKQLLLPRTVF